MTKEQEMAALELIQEALNTPQYSVETEPFAEDRFRMEDDSEATVELRSNGERSEWCVCFDGKTYPFGGDDHGKECAEYAAYRLELNKDSYYEDASFTDRVGPVIFDGKASGGGTFERGE